MHGSKDSVAAGVDDKWPIRSLEPETRFPAGQPHWFSWTGSNPPFGPEFETFIDVVAGKCPSPCTVTDGLEADWIRSLREITEGAPPGATTRYQR